MKAHSHAQDAHLRAMVQSEDHKPLEGLFRVIERDTAKLARKFRHSFMLNLDPGHYRIEVQVPGYKLESFKCVLRPKQGLTHYFTLKKLDFIDVTGRGLGEEHLTAEQLHEMALAHGPDAAATDLSDLPPAEPEDGGEPDESEVIEEAEIIED